MHYFHNLNLDDDIHFEVFSQNAIGRSINSSKIIVRFTTNHVKLRVTKSNALVRKAFWETPESVANIIGYTVFWCKRHVSETHLCKVSTFKRLLKGCYLGKIY